VVLDLSIEAPPSVLPQRRYCDITGLEVRETSESRFIVFMMKLVQASYTDPITGLRFHDKSIYELVKSLVSSRAAITALLAADRGA
jgi:INO80 complex subunit C